MNTMECRKGCGACCIAPSLSSPIPGMPEGKPTGVRCAQLSADNLCRSFGKPGRPAVCSSYQATEEFCGASRGDAMRLLEELVLMTGS
jgi:Fe-S-cluster containining protein